MIIAGTPQATRSAALCRDQKDRGTRLAADLREVQSQGNVPIHTPSMTLLVICAIALIVAGVLLLRASWRGARRHNLIVAFGWLFIAASFVVMSHTMSAERAAAYGILAVSLAAYAIVAISSEVRKPNSRSSAQLSLEPEARPTNWKRAIAKSLLAIVLAGVAAIGIGVAFAVAMPMGPHDRIVIGALLVPILWGGGMAWTLADAKLGRATLILLAISALSYAIAFLPKVLAA